MGFNGLRQADSVIGAVTQTIRLSCDASAQVGDLVRQDTSSNEKVLVAADNVPAQPILGIIRSKVTPTSALITLRGVIDSITLPIGRVYLSQTGQFTNAIPSSNVVQILGYSFGNGKIHFEPNALTTRFN